MFRLIITGHSAGQVCSAMPGRNTDALTDSRGLRSRHGSGRMLLRLPQTEGDFGSTAVTGASLYVLPVRAFPGGGT